MKIILSIITFLLFASSGVFEIYTNAISAEIAVTQVESGSAQTEALMQLEIISHIKTYVIWAKIILINWLAYLFVKPILNKNKKEKSQK